MQHTVSSNTEQELEGILTLLQKFMDSLRLRLPPREFAFAVWSFALSQTHPPPSPT